jgi:lipoprotein NlpI
MAWAQGNEETQKCFEGSKTGSGVTPDLVLQYCSRAIQSGQLSEPNLAIAFFSRGNAYSNKEEYDRAIQDLDQAIRLNPNYASAFYTQGPARFNQGRFEAAVLDFARVVELTPRDQYRILWLYLAQTRAGQNGRDDLARNAARLGLRQWPGPIASMYLGRITAQEVLNAATDTDPTKEREQQCESHFYIGQHLLTQGTKEEGVRMLQAAMATCPENFVEYSGAKAELRRMGY